MITKNDCLLLLSELRESYNVPEEDIQKQTRLVISSKDIPLQTLKFIDSYKPLDVIEFYQTLRRNYNNKRSKLYRNIVREIEDPQEVLTTLSSMLTQILLFSKHCDNKLMFFQHTRAKEISTCLRKYFEDSDITICLQLLRLIKADIKCLEESRYLNTYKN